MVSMSLFRELRRIYLSWLRKAFGRLRLLPDYPQLRPYIRFLFVTTHFGYGLPSDSTSRWTPLPFASGSQPSGPAQVLHLISDMHAWHTKRRLQAFTCNLLPGIASGYAPVD